MISLETYVVDKCDIYRKVTKSLLIAVLPSDKMPFQMDPEVAQAIFALTGGQSPPHGAVGDVQSRRVMLAMSATLTNSLLPPVTDVTQKDFHTLTPDGHSLLLRWYTKSGLALENSPAVLYLHSGGIIAYNVAEFDIPISQYVSLTSIPFLAVEYRLAPEHPYPTPIEDCYTGLQYLKSHSQELGIDQTRLAVMGESGGGGLAASLAHLSLSRSGPAIAKQILIYPMLDDRSMVEDKHLVPFLTWNYDDTATAWGAYLGEDCGGDKVTLAAAAGRMEDATGLPELYIDVGELDIFRDECIVYARKHAAAGISAELHVHPGVPHVFEVLAPNTKVAQRTLADRVRAVLSIKSVGGTDPKL